MDFASDLFTRALQSSATAAVVVGCHPLPARRAYVNTAFQQLTGFAAEDLAARGLDLLHGTATDARSIARLAAAIAEGSELRLVIRSHRKDGSSFWNQLHVMPLRDDCGAPTHFMAMMTDITGERLLAQRLEHRAHHDALTGLPNRHLLSERIEQQLAPEQKNRPFAVVLIDLNHFKQINDTLGHDVGDQLLTALGARLLQCVRPGDTVSRYGGDEFVLLVRGDRNQGRFEDVRTRIDSAMQRPVVIGSYEITVSCSIGVGVYPIDGVDQATLFRKADLGMYSDKSAHRGTSRFSIAASRESDVMIDDMGILHDVDAEPRWMRDVSSGLSDHK